MTASTTTSPTTNNHDDANPLKERWSDANVQAVMKLWSFDPSVETKLRQVQELISDITHWKNDPYEVAGYLFDFKDWTPERIATLFRKMVQWRLDNRIDTYCERYTPPPELAYFPAFLLKDLDRDGDPVYVVRIGAWDAWDMVQRVGADALVDYSQFLQELVATRNLKGVPPHWKWQTEYYEQQGKRHHQFTSVFDLQGLNWSEHLRPALFQQVLAITSRIGQDYYAGSAKRILVLRAPRLFQAAWSMIKQFVDPQMQELIQFSNSSNYKQVWDQYIPLESLPACMGGSDDHREEELMPGYWQRVQMQGGPIPKNLGSTKEQRKMETASVSEDDDSDCTEDTSASVISARSLLRGRVIRDHQVVIVDRASTKKSVSFSPCTV